MCPRLLHTNATYIIVSFQCHTLRPSSSYWCIYCERNEHYRCVCWEWNSTGILYYNCSHSVYTYTFPWATTTDSVSDNSWCTVQARDYAAPRNFGWKLMIKMVSHRARNWVLFGCTPKYATSSTSDHHLFCMENQACPQETESTDVNAALFTSTPNHHLRRCCLNNG